MANNNDIRAKAAADLAVAKAQVAKLEAFLEMLDRYSGSGALEDAPPAPKARPITAARQRSLPLNKGTGALSVILDAALAEIDKAAGVPIQIKPLYHALTSQGHVINGKHPRSNLASVLTKSGKARYVEDQGWVRRETNGAH